MSLPWAIRGPQSALSPGLGAPAAPTAWHMAQTLPKTDLPTVFSATGAGAGAATGAGAAAVAGASFCPQAAKKAKLSVASSSVGLFIVDLLKISWVDL